MTRCGAMFGDATGAACKCTLEPEHAGAHFDGKRAYPGDCRHDPDAKHDFSASKTVVEDAMGTVRRRQFYCTWCGTDRPRRGA